MPSRTKVCGSISDRGHECILEFVEQRSCRALGSQTEPTAMISSQLAWRSTTLLFTERVQFASGLIQTSCKVSEVVDSKLLLKPVLRLLPHVLSQQHILTF